MFRPTITQTSRPSASRRTRRLGVLAVAAVLASATLASAGVADADKSGHVGLEDLSAFLTQWFARDLAADINQNGDVSVDDLFTFIAEWIKEMSSPHRDQGPVKPVTPDRPDIDLDLQATPEQI